MEEKIWKLTSIEMQFAIWNLFNMGRIGNAMTGIGSILAIWLAFRVALNTRSNPETNIVARVSVYSFWLNGSYGYMDKLG
jgi:hypothetical protein